MNVKKEILSKLEEMILDHIRMYPSRHLPCTESCYILNEQSIIKLGDSYRELFNENPVIQIPALIRTGAEIEVKPYDKAKVDIDYPLKELVE